MTAKEFYYKCVDELSFTDDAKFEALCMFETMLNIDKTALVTKNLIICDDDIRRINNAISRRKKSEPLQYILGCWDFYDMTFYVGKGVLIPRPETEMLVDFALEKIKDIESPVIYDLCAGTGCIGLTIANHRKDAKVYLFEKEDEAFNYLVKNKEKYKLDNAIIIKCDIFDYDCSSLPLCDILLSNPPYIETSVIECLQNEVQFEPVSALDGGVDGLDFYHVIYDKWLKQVRKNGFVAFECGEGQSQLICEIFAKKISSSDILFDFNNIDRIVTFRI